MASPDLPGYVDLTIFDRSPSDLVERVKANLLVTLPGFVWREGTVEAAVAESLALIVAELGYQVNRVPAAVFETIAGALATEFDQGSPPTATVEVTVADALGYVIPAGTRFLLPLAGDTNVVFALDADLPIVAPAVSAVGAVTGTTNTAEANGTLIGTALQPVDAIAAVNAAELASAPIDGAGPEAVADWFDRVSATLSRMTSTLVKPAQFEFAAVELEPLVGRVKALDQFDVDLGAGVPGDHPGYISVAVASAAGVALGAPVMDALELLLDDLAQADLTVRVMAPTITAVAVTATVVRLAGFTDLEVEANVEAAIEAYLSPATWGWGDTVYRNELLSIIDQAVGVDRVVSLDLPAADVALAGAAPLADAGVLTITVDAP